MKKNVQYQLHPSSRAIDIKFMVYIIPGILDHHAVDGTHCQQPNGTSISAVTDDLQNVMDGLYQVFGLIHQTESDDLYQNFD